MNTTIQTGAPSSSKVTSPPVELPTGAIVSFPGRDGMGILVEKHWILTSSACIDPEADQFRQGYREARITAGGLEIRCDVEAIEIISGIAVLTVPYFPEFEEFRKCAPRVRVHTATFPMRTACSLYDPHLGWITGIVDEASADKPVVTGYVLGKLPKATGGPVLGPFGELIGVLTYCCHEAPYEGYEGFEATGLTGIRFCRPHLALPGWLSRAISRGYFELPGDGNKDPLDFAL